MWHICENPHCDTCYYEIKLHNDMWQHQSVFSDSHHQKTTPHANMWHKSWPKDSNLVKLKIIYFNGGCDATCF
jgi:hypothetical protein